MLIRFGGPTSILSSRREKLLPILNWRQRLVRRPRLLCRGSILALVHEETWNPQLPKDGYSALAKPWLAYSTCLAVREVLLSALPIERFRRGWMYAPAYAMDSVEPDA